MHENDSDTGSGRGCPASTGTAHSRQQLQGSRKRCLEASLRQTVTPSEPPVQTAHHPPHGRSTQPAQRLVHLGEQPDVNRRVPPLQRARRTAASVPNVSRVLVLTNQPRALCPRQPRDLRHKATHDPLVRLGQPGIAQPASGSASRSRTPPTVGEVKVNRFAAGHEIANLVYGPPPFDVLKIILRCSQTPSLRLTSRGFAPTLQAHVSWDKTTS